MKPWRYILALPQVTIALAVVGAALTGLQFYLTWQSLQQAMEVLGEYVGVPVAKAITAELTKAIGLELEAEGESEALLLETMTLSMAKAAIIAKGKEDEPTIIYRMGSGNATNLTPRVIDIAGLSYQLTVPKKGSYTVTSIELINATGKLIAIQDGLNHVSVIPINITRMPEWIDSRPNALANPHEFTKIIADVSIKVK